MPELAQRLAAAPTAATVTLTARAREMRAQGLDVISLTIGEPDFATPPHVIEAAHRAALDGQTKYPPQDGTPALKAAIRRRLARDGLEYGLDEIVVANGGKQVIFDALMATLDPGSEVIVLAPYWNAYPLMARLLGGVAVTVDCLEADGFRPRAEAIEAAITPRTRWLVLNFPNNPTGAVCDAAELSAIGAMLERHPHVWVMSDDLYERLRFDGQPHATLALAAPALRERTLTLGGVSKTYAMTGWRVGYGAGPRALVRAMATVQGHATAGVCAPAQAAAAAALDGPQDDAERMRDAYRRRRDLVVDALAGVPGLRCHRPDGAFYVFPSVAGLIGRCSAGGRALDTDEDVCMAILEEAHVATVFGAAFGMSPFLRLSCATGDELLAEACRRIAAFCRSVG
ncbi:MAG: pyridoxal phosphate-dependent aminotransferase [Janthinobacterium lividum]